jgi:hypothetical protein
MKLESGEDVPPSEPECAMPERVCRRSVPSHEVIRQRIAMRARS